MDFPKKQQQCLIPRYLLQYLQDLQISHNDPTAPWGGGGGGGSYTAGDGIDITNDVISVDNTVALKTDIPSLTGYATETWVTNQGYLVQSDLSDYVTTSELTTELSNYVTSTDLAAELLNYAELSDIPTKTSDLTNDSGYITSSALTGYATESWVTNQGYSTFSGSYNDLTNKPTIPTKTSDLTNDSGYVTTQELLANYVTLKGTQTISGSKNFTGLTTFQGTYYNVYFGQSTGLNVSDKNNPIQESMSIYPGYLYAHRDTGNTTRDGNFFLGNHYFSAYNSDTEYKIKLVNKGGATTYGEYTFKNKTGDVAITSEIPTATSDLTNDSGYITSSALTGYATESWVTNQGYSTFSGNYNDLTNKPTIPDAVSGTNDGTNWTSLTIGSNTYNIPSGGGSSYTAGDGIDITNNEISVDSTVVALKSDIPSLTGYATQSWVRNQGYSKVYGSYSGSYWTSITINGTTKSIPSGGSSADAVDLTSNQDITGVKTFVGKQKLKFKQTGSNDILGFTAYDYNSNEVGNLQIANRTVGGNSNMYVTLGNYSGYPGKSKVGFRLQPNSSTNSYNFVMPYGTNDQFTNNGYSTTADTTIPCAFTDGTTIVKADATGLVNISSISGGGGGGTTVSGTNNGTNWTSITIGPDTYGIPSGGSSSGPTVTRYTGYTNHSPSISSATGYFYLYSSTSSNCLDIRNVKEGDYVEITIKYSWVNPNINMTEYEYETVKLYVPARNTQAGYDALLESKEKRIYNASNIETYIFHNPYTISQKAGNYIFISGTNKYDYIFRIYTCNRNYYNNAYGTMNATIVSLDHYSF